MSASTLVTVLLGTLVLTAAPMASALDPGTGEPLGDLTELGPLPGPLEPVRDDDRGALEALALYQEPVRTAILEVARHPHALIALERIQTQTRTSFRALLEPLAEEERDRVWELVRYPALVGDLAGADEKTRREIEEIEALAQRYPEEVRAAAVAISRDHPELLREVHRLQLLFEVEFEDLVHGLTREAEAALRKALEHPVVLEILSAHMHLTVLLGEAYERDPESLELALASVANEVAARTAIAQEEWIRSLEEDPEALAELERAGETYAEAEGLDYYEATHTTGETEVALVVQPYPYWFGFPSAYVGFYYGFHPYAGYWYPEHQHHFGYYYEPRERIIVYGFPSHYFLSWYFGAGSHDTHYPRLSRHLTRHHSAHRYSHDRVAHHVERWLRASRPRDERLRVGDRRVAGFRDSGRLARATRRSVREHVERRSRSLTHRSTGRSGLFARVVEQIQRDRPRAPGRKRASALRQRPARDTRRAVLEHRSPQLPRRSAKSDAGRSRRPSAKRGVVSRGKHRPSVSKPSRAPTPRAAQHRVSPGRGRAKAGHRGRSGGLGRGHRPRIR